MYGKSGTIVYAGKSFIYMLITYRFSPMIAFVQADFWRFYVRWCALINWILLDSAAIKPLLYNNYYLIFAAFH